MPNFQRYRLVGLGYGCSKPFQCFLHGPFEAWIENGLMQEVDGIGFESVNGILGECRCENKSYSLRQLASEVNSIVGFHLNVEKHNIGPMFPDPFHSSRRGGERVEFNTSHPVTVFLNYTQGYGFIVDGNAFNHDGNQFVVLHCRSIRRLRFPDCGVRDKEARVFFDSSQSPCFR